MPCTPPPGGVDDEPHPTFAMTEQPRTISRRRIATVAGKVDDECLGAIRRWLNDFLYD